MKYAGGPSSEKVESKDLKAQLAAALGATRAAEVEVVVAPAPPGDAAGLLADVRGA